MNNYVERAASWKEKEENSEMLSVLVINDRVKQIP